MPTLQFVQGTGLFDKAIMAYTRSWATHVDAVMPDGRLLGSQSQEFGVVPAGVQARPPDYEPFAKAVRVALPASPQQERAFWAFLGAQVGKPYDYDAIAGIALGRDWHQDGRWFCSELIAVAAEDSEIFPYPLSVAAPCLTPPNLLLACSVLARIDP